MSTLRLDSQAIMQLLGDPAFYQSCHAYMFMRDQGLAAAARYNKLVASHGADCDGCTGNEQMNLRTTMTQAFVRIADMLGSRENMEPVHKFIERKLGRQVESVLLSYEQDGTMKELKF